VNFLDECGRFLSACTAASTTVSQNFLNSKSIVEALMMFVPVEYLNFLIPSIVAVGGRSILK
jgi:hypothetical protein